MGNLIGDIFEIGRRPVLGPSPNAANAEISRSTGYSQAALTIAEHFVRTSETGNSGTLVKISDLRAQLNLSRDDAVDGIDELRKVGMLHVVKVMSGTEDHVLTPEPRLFASFDRYWRNWDPEIDAGVLAAEVQARTGRGVPTAEIGKVLGWPVRRLNPALMVLLDHGAVKSAGEKSYPEVRRHVWATDETRRYIKARS
jgi:hypothetical protein